MDSTDVAIMLTFMNRDEPYNEAELLVVNQAAKRLGVKMSDAFHRRVEYILSTHNNPVPLPVEK